MPAPRSAPENPTPWPYSRRADDRTRRIAETAPAPVVIPSPRGESVVRPRPYSPPLASVEPTSLTAHDPPQDDPTVVIAPVPDLAQTVVAPPTGHGLRIVTPTDTRAAAARTTQRALLLVGAGVAALVVAIAAVTSGPGSADVPADSAVAAPAVPTPAGSPAPTTAAPAPATTAAEQAPPARAAAPAQPAPPQPQEEDEEVVAERSQDDCDRGDCALDAEDGECDGGRGNPEPRGAAHGLDRGKEDRDCDEG